MLIDLFEDAYMWIGLYNRDSDGVYRYISTGSLTYIVDLWDKDQPSANRHVVTQAKKNGKWSTVVDYKCKNGSSGCIMDVSTYYYFLRIYNKFYSVCEKL
jgi:hypothetical protein